MRGSRPSAGILVAAGLAACASPAEEPVTTRTVTTTSSVAGPVSAPELRKIPLRRGMRITIGATADGGPSILVRIPEGWGLPPGDYTSSSAHLVEEFRAVAETLGAPGNAAWMEVDERNEIVTVAHEVTLQ